MTSEAVDGFRYRNHVTSDFMFGWQKGKFLYDKSLLPDETVEQLKVYEEPYRKAQTPEEYWKIRNNEIAKLREKRPSTITFEQSVVHQINLGLFTFAVINGAFVRKYFDHQFVQGGQHNVYDYVPERWFVAEKALDPREYPLVFFHEFSEYLLMFVHKQYQDCHYVADKIERFIRKLAFGASYPVN